MEICDIMLRLAGSNDNIVPKLDVTPAEILILRHLHGADSVFNIRPKGSDKRTHAGEWERLKGIYGRNGQSTSDGSTVMLDSIFPGAIKQLPVGLSDIPGEDADAVAEPEEA